eukprot:3109110-Pyramimonas_sp.AAC.1
MPQLVRVCKAPFEAHAKRGQKRPVVRVDIRGSISFTINDGSSPSAANEDIVQYFAPLPGARVTQSGARLS